MPLTLTEKPGIDLAVDGTNLDISVDASEIATPILDAVKTVDGTGSGLDADLLDGVQGASFVRSDTADSVDGVLTFNAIPAFNGGTSGSTAPFTVDSTLTWASELLKKAQ